MWFLLAAAISTPEVTFCPADAVTFAVADLNALAQDQLYDVERQKFIRYIWTDGSNEQAQGVSVAVNTAWSKASNPIPLSLDNLVAGGHLVRIEFDKLFPEDADLKKALETWELQAQQDPYFYLKQKVETTPYKADDGKTYNYKILRSFGGHVSLKDALELQKFTGSGFPIQRADKFVVSSLSQLNGGFYYKLAGIEKSKNKNQTDFELFLENHGVDKQTLEKFRNANRRAAVFKSGVTAKPRGIEEVPGIFGTVTWTEDIKDGNFNPKFHPLRTLLRTKFDAIEAIAIKANGYCDYALFNDKEELQEVVPDIVARDTTIPEPYTSPLQPAISCMSCHALNSGFRTARNDVLKLLTNLPEGNLKLDILGDFGFDNTRKFIDEVASKFRGKLERLDRGREDLADAVFLSTVTGRDVSGASLGGLSVEKAFTIIKTMRNNLLFKDVTPMVAALDLGVKCKDGDEALQTIRYLLPPVKQESVVIGLGLKADVGVTRQDWEPDYIDAAVRSRPQYEKLAQKHLELKKGKP